MFCVAVRFVVSSWFPMDAELTLVDTVFDPVEAHVHCFGTFGFDCVVGNSFGCGIVCLDWSGTVLFPAHLFEGFANDASVLSIEEQASEFGFGRRGYNVAQDFA